MITLVTCQSSIEHESKYKIECDIHSFREWMSGRKEIQVDTETEGLDVHSHKIITIQIGDTEDQFVFDWWSLDKESRQYIKSILEDPGILKLFHNASFDMQVLWSAGIDTVNVYDTMIAEMVITAGEEFKKGRYTLFNLVRQYCNVSLDKSIRSDIKRYGLSTSVIEYAAKDVQYLQRIRDKQKETIDKHRLSKVIDLEMKCIIPLASIEYNGMLLDRNKWKTLKQEVNKEVVNTKKVVLDYLVSEEKLRKYTTVYADFFTPPERRLAINLSSPQQKLEMLRTIIPEIESTNERTLSRYKNKYKLVQYLLELSQIVKLKTAFADTMEDRINPATGRIHPSIKQLVSTGRLAFSKPNLQQVPARSAVGKVMRESFIAAPGNVIVGADYSGCELRILADLSGDQFLIDILNQGKDLHSELCKLTFDISDQEVRSPFPFKNSLSYRDVQKTINFGLAYGMSEYKLSDTLGIEVSKAKEIIDKFFSKVPKLKEFLEKAAAFGEKNRYIHTIPYRRIRWFDRKDNISFADIAAIGRKSKNHPIQGANADMVKLALVLLYEEIKRNNYPVKLILQVHDEIQTECSEEFAPEWKEILENKMEEAAKHILKKVDMKVDASISKHWTK